MLIAVEEVAGTVALKPNTKSNTEVAKPQAFDRIAGKVLEFLTTCKLFIRMRMRGDLVKKQIQWILSYMQRGSADVCILEDLKAGNLEYEIVEEFLADLKIWRRRQRSSQDSRIEEVGVRK